MIVVLVLGLFLLATPMAVSADGVTVTDKIGDGEWVGNTWKVPIYPSESKSTTLTLYNSSSSPLDVDVALPGSLDNGNLTFELDKSDFTMSGGSYTDITLTLRASDSATPGTYTAGLLEIRTEVPPTPIQPQPAPPAPEPEEGEPEPEVEVVEPVEPEEEEPEPIEPVEPEEPEELEEPPTTVIEEPEEPEVIEPEVMEPEAEELVVEEWEMSWLLTISLSSSLSVIAGIICWFWLRRRRRRSRMGVSS